MFFGSITYRAIHHDATIYSEFGFHIEKAQAMSMEGRVLEPHFLFHVLTISVHDLISQGKTITQEPKPSPEVFDSWAFSAWVVITTAYISATFILYYAFRRALKPVSQSIVLAFCLSIVAPIFLWAPIDGWYYLGYLSPSTVYIIPTQVLLKVTTLGLFLLSVSMLRDTSNDVRKLLLLSFLVVINGLAKPNYLIIMGPALLTLVAIQIRRGQVTNLKMVAACLLPAVTVLAWQFHFKFVNTNGLIYESTIIFTKPFEVWSARSHYVPFKVLLSSAFPIYVTIAYWGSVKNCISMQYAWLLYFYGLFFTAFVAESGFAKNAGNFVWSGQIGNFALFVATALVFFGGELSGKGFSNQKFLIGVSIFGLHVIAGVFYYFRSFTHIFT